MPSQASHSSSGNVFALAIRRCLWITAFFVFIGTTVYLTCFSNIIHHVELSVGGGVNNARVAWYFEPAAPRPGSQPAPVLDFVPLVPVVMSAQPTFVSPAPEPVSARAALGLFAKALGNSPYVKAFRNSPYVKAFRNSGYLTSFAQRLGKGEFLAKRVFALRELTAGVAAALLRSPLPPPAKILPPTRSVPLPLPDPKGWIYGEDIDTGIIVASVILGFVALLEFVVLPVIALVHYLKSNRFGSSRVQDPKFNDVKAELVVCEEDDDMDYFDAMDSFGEDIDVDGQDAWVVCEDTDDQDAHDIAGSDLDEDSNDTDNSVDGELVGAHRLNTAGLSLQVEAVAGSGSVYLSPFTPAGPCLMSESLGEILSSVGSTLNDCGDLDHDSNNTDKSVDGELVGTHRLNAAGLPLQAGAVAGSGSVYLSPSTPAGPCPMDESLGEILSPVGSTPNDCGDLDHDSNNTDNSVDGELVGTHRLNAAGLPLQAGAVAGPGLVYLSPSTPAGPCFMGESLSEIPSPAGSTPNGCLPAVSELLSSTSALSALSFVEPPEPVPMCSPVSQSRVSSPVSPSLTSPAFVDLEEEISLLDDWSRLTGFSPRVQPQPASPEPESCPSSPLVSSSSFTMTVPDNIENLLHNDIGLPPPPPGYRELTDEDDDFVWEMYLRLQRERQQQVSAHQRRADEVTARLLSQPASQSLRRVSDEDRDVSLRTASPALSLSASCGWSAPPSPCMSPLSSHCGWSMPPSPCFSPLPMPSPSLSTESVASDSDDQMP
ncbi:hypothetical protein FISHEDRAFT_73579 [Fistulina hepatica ATCC 64428]|uniref:Transmembrane protein n=1 Tax=Fistulina hepatica ATCC 64428 TaxID=1128425 RepID=A0A0D7ACN9_9AGAR|nr:hypothetical protein FISHEDRAFT_73579 [Fistulina hepatica ATCC 64428]